MVIYLKDYIMSKAESDPFEGIRETTPLETLMMDVFGDQNQLGILGPEDVESYQVDPYTKIVMLWREGREPEYDKIQAILRETHVSWKIDEAIDPVLPIHEGTIPGVEVRIVDDHNLENPFIAFEFRTPPQQISPVLDRINQL